MFGLKRAPLVNLLRLSGPIGQAGALRPGMTAVGLEGALRRAFAGRRLAAVALVVNSPGGLPVQSALIGRRIRQLADKRKVPVLAFAEDVAASGGYWLLAAGDELFAEHTSIVGSIGVISAGFGLHRAIERFGIERRVYTAGSRKAQLDPFRPEDPADRAHVQAIQADMHDAFKAWVRERRGARLSGPEEVLFSGDFWTGRQALGLGLVDALGDARTVVKQRFGDRVRLRTIPTERLSLLQRLRPGLDLAAAVEERLMWARWGC